MASCLIEIADAVAAELNDASFDPPFTAVRAYVPTYDLTELADVKVTVVPRSLTLAGGTRSKDAFEAVINVGVQQKVDTSDAPTLDALMGLTQEILDYLRNKRLDDLPEVLSISAEIAVAVSPEMLVEKRVFCSVLSFTYRVYRE